MSRPLGPEIRSIASSSTPSASSRSLRRSWFLREPIGADVVRLARERRAEPRNVEPVLVRQDDDRSRVVRLDLRERLLGPPDHELVGARNSFGRGELSAGRRQRSCASRAPQRTGRGAPPRRPRRRRRAGGGRRRGRTRSARPPERARRRSGAQPRARIRRRSCSARRSVARPQAPPVRGHRPRSRRSRRTRSPRALRPPRRRALRRSASAPSGESPRRWPKRLSRRGRVSGGRRRRSRAPHDRRPRTAQRRGTHSARATKRSSFTPRIRSRRPRCTNSATLR